jgi:peptidoglycan/LPS O-acetylase OafA/YrhL
MGQEKQLREGYRADIDGLRAIAVLLVLAYHFELVSFTGGFVGVDVFFVISGYVITRSIMAAQSRGEHFSYLDFIARRILRLALPAIVVVFVSLCLGWFTLTTEEYQSLGRSAAASLFFVANIYFSRRTGYFAPNSDEQPLLHMWSLGVEEQFYILAPILIATIAARPRLRLLAWLGVFAVSFGLACLASFKGNADGYFLLQYRAFEIALGVIVAIAAFEFRFHASAVVAGIVGLALIAASAVLIDSSTLFPGPWALMPCIGAALVIVAGANRDTPVFQLLSQRLFIIVGTLSYALYLWHWPLLAFAKIGFGRALNGFDTACLLLATFALAVATRYLIERPLIMRSAHEPGRRLAAMVAGCGVCIAVLAGVVGATGVRWRMGPVALAQEAHILELKSATFACSLTSDAPCYIGDKDAPISFLIWGDSHALSLSSAFDAIGRTNGQRGVLLAEGGCPPLMNSAGDTDNPRAAPRCSQGNQKLLQLLEQHPTIRRIVLHARWATYTETDHRRRSVQLRQRNVDQSRVVLAQSLEGAIGFLTARGLVVSVVGPVPSLQRNPGVQQVRDLLQSGRFPDNALLAVPVATLIKSNAPVLEMLDALPSKGKVTVLYPHSVLCSELSCRTIDGRSPLYYDDNHLNAAGAQQLIPLLKRALGAQ